MSSYFNFANKTAVITGATSGIGNCVARRLYNAGCNLICITSNEKGKTKLVDQFPNCIVFKCDFRSKKQCDELIENLSSLRDVTFDILINSAGVFPLKNLLSSNIQDFNDCFDINVKSAFLLSTFIGKQMCNGGSGRIVNIGSSSAYNGSEDAGIYCSSKHALLGLSRSLYKEFRPRGVRVYSISPGSCQTPMGKTDKRQDFSTFITTREVSKVVVDILKFNGEGIMEEVRINRMVIR